VSDKLYSTAEVAELLGTSDGHIRMVIRRHPELAPRKIGRAWVWTEENINALREYLRGTGSLNEEELK